MSLLSYKVKGNYKVRLITLHVPVDVIYINLGLVSSSIIFSIKLFPQ